MVFPVCCLNISPQVLGSQTSIETIQKLKLPGNSLSIVFATGGIVSAVATSGVCLAAVSTVSVLIQGWMSHQNPDLKIQNCTYANQSYAHVLFMLKDMMRSGEFEEGARLNTVQNIGNYVIDTSPVVVKYLYKYDKVFTD